jgi:damage-control phosphatase, subfamily I
LKTYFDCYPCFLRQALHAAKLSGANEGQTEAILRQTLELMQSLPAAATPPEIGHQVHQIVRTQVGAHDPYHQVKEKSTRQSLALYPKLKELVRKSGDPLRLAIRLSIAGNILDFGVSNQPVDLWQTVEKVIKQPFSIDDVGALKDKLQNVEQVLYLADNAGETVFDRVLIEELPVPVLYAVKEAPILNDATREDALAAGLDACATIITTGAQAMGVIMPLVSADFRRQFDQAALVIAKGQANYETLSEAGEKIFCLLQAKCEVIAADLDVPVGSIVVRRSTSR